MLPEEQVMKAIVQDRFGGPEVLELRDVDVPAVSDDGVLVRVHASGVNPVDWHFMRGEPLFMRLIAGLRTPKLKVLGFDIAGTVERTGASVTDFQPGDEVWGFCKGGGFAEYVSAPAVNLLPKPAKLPFVQAGGIAIAAFTALQGVRDHGEVGAGTRVLIVGASGGVGTFAIQIARALGAHVTGVCSTRKVELVRSLGADEVIDYTRDDFADRAGEFDVLLHVAGNRSVKDCLRTLKPDGILVNIGGGEDGGRLLGPLKRLLSGVWRKPFVNQEIRGFTARVSMADDGLFLQEMLEDGRIKTVVDRTYPLVETADAIRYVESLRARGKVVITV